MIEYMVRRAGQDADVEYWYRRAGIRRATIALHIGKTATDHAEKIDVMIQSEDPEAEPLTPAGLAALEAVWQEMQDHRELIRLDAAMENPCDLIPRRQPEMMLSPSIEDEVTKISERARRGYTAKAVKKVATGDPASRFRDQQAKEKAPFVEAYCGIAERATKAMQAADPPGMPDLVRSVREIADTEEDRADLMSTRFSSGRVGTMRNHVPRWLGLEIWFTEWRERRAEDTIYPLTERVWVQHLRHLDGRLCGPSVPMATRAAIHHVGKKVGFAVGIVSAIAQDIIDRVLEERGKEIKEAAPPPIWAVRKAEAVVTDPDAALFKRVVYGIWTMAIWAAGRGFDVINIWPGSLELHEMFMGAIAGKTKTTNRTRIVVPNVWLDTPWLEIFYELFHLAMRQMYPDKKTLEKEYKRDHLFTKIQKRGDRWIPEPGTIMKAPDFAKMHNEILVELGVPEDQRKKMTPHGIHGLIGAYAGHSPTADVLSTQVACRWKSPEMAMKYARQTGGMGIRMVRELARDLAEGWDPLAIPGPAVSLGGRDRGPGALGSPLKRDDLPPALQEMIEDVDRADDGAVVEVEDLPLYYNAVGHEWQALLQDGAWTKRHQGHLLDLADPKERLACRRFKIKEGVNFQIGRTVGDVLTKKEICADCVKKRWDVQAYFDHKAPTDLGSVAIKMSPPLAGRQIAVEAVGSAPPEIVTAAAPIGGARDVEIETVPETERASSSGDLPAMKAPAPNRAVPAVAAGSVRHHAPGSPAPVTRARGGGGRRDAPARGRERSRSPGPRSGLTLRSRSESNRGRTERSRERDRQR